MYINRYMNYMHIQAGDTISPRLETVTVTSL